MAWNEIVEESLRNRPSDLAESGNILPSFTPLSDGPSGPKTRATAPQPRGFSYPMCAGGNPCQTTGRANRAAAVRPTEVCSGLVDAG